MTNTISIYADGAIIDSESGDSIMVTVKNIDIAQLVSEFNIEELLQALVDTGKDEDIIEFAGNLLKGGEYEY